MTFRETKLKATLHNIDTGKLLIADEIESVCCDIFKTYEEKEYEEVCSYAYEIYLKTDYTANEIALAVHYLLSNKKLTIKQLIDLTKTEFIEMGIRYI